MAWTASGLYANSLAAILGGSGGVITADSWLLSTNKFYLTGVADTPSYSQSLATAIYATTNEVHDSTNWPAGGVAASGLGTGPSNMALTFSVTTPGSVTTLNWLASQAVSVATTTLTSAYGGFLYQPATTVANSKIIGIYFGGSGYSTTAGTFAITWSSGTIATIALATTT